MVGLRTQESKKFERFFEIVQREANSRGSVFYGDCGEGHMFENELMECEDLRGWLIPLEKSKEFEEEFLKGNDPEDWDDYICWAVWKDENDPKISFEFY